MNKYPSNNPTPSIETPDTTDTRDRIADTMKGISKLPVTATYAELEQSIPEVAAMKGFDQRSDFHSLPLDQHVKKVVRGLEENPFIASHEKRDLILLAGQLHDLGKTSPEGQQIHPKDPEKRQYVGHEKVSGMLAAELLPRHFDLTEEDREFVVQLATLHASALNLITSFTASNGEPKGKKLKAFDKFIQSAEAIPGTLSTEDKMRIIFAFNRADKMGGYDETSDPSDPKVQDIVDKSNQQVAVLDELEKALSAILEAVQAKRDGDNTAGVVKVDGQYYYDKKMISC